MDSSFWLNWASSSLRLSSPLALTAVGAVYSERSGIFNIGLEGMMLSGAFFGILGSHLTGSALMGALAGGAAGMLLGLVLGFCVIACRADQIIVGVAINLFALGLTNLLFRDIFGGSAPERVARFGEAHVPLAHSIPGLGPVLFEQRPLVYLAIVLPLVLAWVLFQTAWGLSVRAVGEHPAAADTAGIPVRRVRYLCVMFSGLMAGLGGAALALQGAGYFAQNMTAGRGFVVLGAVVVGKWNPAYAALACLLFGAADALQLNAQTFGFSIPSEFFVVLPYVLTVAALAGLVGRTRQPRKLGVAYSPDEV
jgi:ABC-type uncharacterized transport system permease subunit